MRGLEYLALMGLNPSVPTAYRDGATVFEMLGGLQSKLNDVITVVNDTFSSEDGEVMVRELVTQILSEDIKLDGYVTRVELEYATSLLGTMPIEQSYTTDQPDRYVDGYDYFIRLRFYGADDVSIGASQPLQLSRVFDYLKDAKTLNGEDFSYFASKQELNAYETVANATLKYATKQDIADLSAGITPGDIEETGLVRSSEAVKAMKLQYAVTESSTPPDPSAYSDTVPLYTVSSTLWVRINYTMVNDAEYFTEGTSLLSDYVKLMFTHSNLNAASLGGIEASEYALKSDLESVSMSDAAIMEAVKREDGEGSGLDADTLDGLHATSFATAAQGARADSALQASSYTASDVLEKIKSVDGPDSGLDADTLDGLHGSDFATAEQGLAADGALPRSDFTANSVLSKIKTVDGSGSGLDADTVDGLESSSFVRNDLPKQLIGINPFVWGEDTYSSYLQFYGSNSNLLGMIGFNTASSNMTLKANTGVLNLDTPNRSGGLRHNGQRVPTIAWGTNPPTTGVPGQIYIKI